MYVVLEPGSQTKSPAPFWAIKSRFWRNQRPRVFERRRDGRGSPQMQNAVSALGNDLKNPTINEARIEAIIDSMGSI